jgi:hypothetical protein
VSLKHDADGFLVGQPIGPLTLRGVLADTLGGMLVVRGYAKLSTLAARSVADAGYQRALKPEHLSAIQAFYKQGEYLFFPEVVLALELQVDYEKAGKPDAAPLQLIQQGLAFKSNVNGVSVKATKTKAAADLTRVNISLPEAAGKALKRIDGNHRISAFEAMDDVEMLDRKPVSFCIVLLPQGQARQFEKALFYNINSKALPLTSEEVYRGIVEDEAGFADDVLEKDFGTEFVLCRQTRKLLDFAYLPHLLGVFGQNAGQADCRCSVLIEALRDLQSERSRLLDASPLPSADVLLQTIQTLNATYADNRLQRANALGLFSAFLFFATQSGSRYRQFETWVLKNHQYELQTINASDLIRIFEKIAESRHRQIFVSMQFKIQDANGLFVDNPNWKAIESAVTELNREHQFDLELKPIRIDEFDKGFSYPISSEISQLIEDSGYLIADLTAGNKNVYHEVGLLMGLNQARQKGHENFLLLHNSSVGDVNKDFGFNIADFKQLRLNDTHSIGQQVKKQVAIYYGLAVAE